MRFEVGQKRIAIAARNLSLVLSAVIVGVIVIAAAISSQEGTSSSSLAANPNNVNSSSSSLGSSSSVSSSGSSTNTQSSTVQSSVQQSSSSSSFVQQSSSSQYALAWAAKPLNGCNLDQFCLDAMLSFPGQQTVTSTSTEITTVTGSNNVTTIFSNSYTLIVSDSQTVNIIGPSLNYSYQVGAFAYLQEAATGQNVTTHEGNSFIGNSCAIQPTGITNCYIGGNVPSGHTYKVTVYITKGGLPCPLASADESCTSQLLAPLLTTTVSE
jgi:hypothetical protein